MIAVAMQIAFEAVIIRTDRCPSACMIDVGAQEEFEVLAVSDMAVKCALTKVEELLQLRGTIGSIGDAAIYCYGSKCAAGI